MTNRARPAPDEIEVSLFGPGLGESVVVHMGNDRWLVVDSCRSSGSSVPLEYLREIGVDVGSDVVLVMASHAHDDHIRGIAELYREAKRARLGVPAASTREEFAALLKADELQVSSRLRVLSEFSELFEEMKIRVADGQRAWFGVSDRSLVLDSGSNGGLVPASIVALTPSDEDVLASLEDLGAAFPSAGDLPRRALNRDPNHFAMALVVRCGDRQVVLGSDVLTGAGGKTGWSAALVDHDQLLPSTEIYKVAHHGSETGHHDEAWTRITENGVISILTPFLQGRVKLPKADDLARIKAGSSNAYVSSGTPKLSRSQQRLAASAAGSSTGVRLRQGDNGHIRARARAFGEPAWTVDTFGHARRV